MPIPVSAAFVAAVDADVNRPKARVELVLGNYASAAAYGTVAAASGAAANYPAAGAIDGDRTEINVGPASGADNDVGQSSWRSTVAPDTTPQTLTLTFAASRTINRLKLYHLSGHALDSYRFAYWNGTTWVDFAATSDIAGPGEVSIETTGELDVVDFPDVATTQLRLTVSSTATPADMANVVELEVYRVLDVSDRVSGVTLQRQRDYKLGNPLASSLVITGINDDRFFSISHVPTAQEVLDGFVNDELRPGMGIVVSLGFDLEEGGDELVSAFVGTVDKIRLKPGAREAVIEARDGMKALINKKDSTKLKTATAIEGNIRYVLNRANVSDYEMDLDATSINIDYFFAENQDQLSTIRDLTQAAVDALFFFDEEGVATFKFFQASTTLEKLWTSDADWNAGTFAGDMDAVSNNLVLDGSGAGVGETVTGTAMSTLLNIPAAPNGINELAFRILAPGDGTITQVYMDATLRFLSAIPRTYNLQVRLYDESGGSPGSVLTQSTFTFSDTTTNGWPLPAFPVSFPVTRGTAYWIAIGQDPANGPNCLFDIVRMRIADSSWSGGVNSKARAVALAVCPGKDSAVWVDVEDTSSSSGIGQVAGNYVYTGDAMTGSWESATLDTGANVNSYGGLTKTQVLNAGTSAYYTASSPDGVTWDAWVPISGTGQIISAVQRYLKVRADLALSNNSFTGPFILDITVSWTVGGGSPKYPPAPAAFTFSFDSTLLDVEQEISDNIGGDTSILNDVTVQAQPLVLTGADADTVWQGSLGTPPTNISVSNPLSVTNGDVLVIEPVVGGGMDISRMSGANPPAAVVTFAGGGAGSWLFSSIHPTRPVLRITITGTGTITDLRITGKKFSNVTYLQARNAEDAASIALHGSRELSIRNPWIVSASVAQTIADQVVANQKDPTAYIPSAEVRPNFAVQIGDRATVADENLDLSADYILVGYNHVIAVKPGEASASTTPTLMKVPVGS